MTRKFGQDSSLVAKSGADPKNRLVLLRSKEVRHKHTHQRLRNRLVEPDRKRHIRIRHIGKRFRHQKVPRYAQHDPQDPLIEHRIPKFFLYQVSVDTNDLDHVPTQDCEVHFVHRLHAIRRQSPGDLTDP